MGFPATIYALLVYLFLFKGEAGPEYMEYPLLFMGLGLFAVNAGRIISAPSLMRSYRNSTKVWGRLIIYFTLPETFAIFLLLTGVLGWILISSNDMPAETFVRGMMYMSLAAVVGAILQGFIVKHVHDVSENAGDDEISKLFRKTIQYSMLPQGFAVLGIFLILITYLPYLQQ